MLLPLLCCVRAQADGCCKVKRDYCSVNHTAKQQQRTQGSQPPLPSHECKPFKMLTVLGSLRARLPHAADLGSISSFYFERGDDFREVREFVHHTDTR